MTRSDPKRWWRPLTPVVKAGQVTLFEGDANFTQGQLHLAVPEVPAGRYYLMLCDLGCRIPLGNHIPVPVIVAVDPVVAKTVRRLEESNERLRLALARIRRDVRHTQRQLQHAEAQVTGARDAGLTP
jgi:hypothetical protein